MSSKCAALWDTAKFDENVCASKSKKGQAKNVTHQHSFTDTINWQSYIVTTYST